MVHVATVAHAHHRCAHAWCVFARLFRHGLVWWAVRDGACGVGGVAADANVLDLVDEVHDNDVADLEPHRRRNAGL